MRLSLQTVGIVLGVTLIHVFVIAAFSPVEGERGGPPPTLEIDPVIEALLDDDSATPEQNLAERDGLKEGATEGHDEMALPPTHRIREIRAVQPIPRS